ncbi:MAG: phosphohydrolase [Desulfobacteraceae bacterium]|nr:phosphohydrolase [Desulfobacteraceae bacterium]
MTPEEIILEYYPRGSKACEILMRHGEQVAEKSLEIAGRLSHLSPDLDFIREAAMLHDIGIFMTKAPGIGCFGEHAYLCHGYLGRQLLDSLGLPAHGLVAERHTGAGITKANILDQGLPLPCRDMVPETLEETIICVADKFFSKSPGKEHMEKSREIIFNELADIDVTHARRFSQWADRLIPSPA